MEEMSFRYPRCRIDRMQKEFLTFQFFSQSYCELQNKLCPYAVGTMVVPNEHSLPRASYPLVYHKTTLVFRLESPTSMTSAPSFGFLLIHEGS
jgi:hypothetical protein